MSDGEQERRPVLAEPVRKPGAIELWGILTVHVALAAGWWHFMPGGFPVGHARWWTNTVLPWLMILAGLAGLLGLMRSRRRPAALVATFYAFYWVGVALTSWFVFPQSARLLALAPLVVGAILARRGIRHLRYSYERRFRLTVGAALPAVACAAVTVFSQRATEPHTRPLNVRPPPRSASLALPSSRPSRLGDSVFMWADEPRVQTRIGPLTLDFQPMLQFISCSPDRCWTSLAPRDARRGPEIAHIGTLTTADQIGAWFAGSPSDALFVRRAGGLIAEIEAFTTVQSPIYSHLNSYCWIMISGHARLSLAFSPCPGVPIEVLPADYPVGRPIRAAYMDAAGGFHVVQASSGEKGPFEVLAEGRLSRGEPLGITFLDEDRPICTAKLMDWSSQVCLDLSPTAGWGLPAGTVTFSRSGERKDDAGFIYVTLADTGLGRGWDTVGHAAGIYRNRIRIQED